MAEVNPSIVPNGDCRYEPVPGFHVNGELTLGENIADNSGLAIAYKAYKISLGGESSTTIDGMTGDQRFFADWRAKVRENEAIVRIKSDPHSPPAVRGYAPLVRFIPVLQKSPGSRARQYRNSLRKADVRSLSNC
jgi:hypothetical protein